MSIRKIAALQMGLLLAAMVANAAASKDVVSKDMVRITVLDSVTRALTPDNNGVPQNCEQLTFDAYCRSTTNVPLLSTLLVQEDNQPPFRISCTVESKYSRCVPLPKGASFDARREKHGLEVYYLDDKGKTRKQLYTLVASDAKASQPAAAATLATQPVPAAASGQSSPAPAPAAPAVAAQQVLPEKGLEKVRCNFASTPAGADINLDGKYVGSTPSEIAVSPGTHVVAFSLPGFAPWTRDLTVEKGSGVVNVTASLQKTQP